MNKKLFKILTTSILTGLYAFSSISASAEMSSDFKPHVGVLGFANVYPFENKDFTLSIDESDVKTNVESSGYHAVFVKGGIGNDFGCLYVLAGYELEGTNKFSGEKIKITKKIDSYSLTDTSKLTETTISIDSKADASQKSPIDFSANIEKDAMTIKSEGGISAGVGLSGQYSINDMLGMQLSGYITGVYNKYTITRADLSYETIPNDANDFAQKIKKSFASFTEAEKSFRISTVGVVLSVQLNLDEGIIASLGVGYNWKPEVEIKNVKFVVTENFSETITKKGAETSAKLAALTTGNKGFEKSVPTRLIAVSATKKEDGDKDKTTTYELGKEALKDGNFSLNISNNKEDKYDTKEITVKNSTSNSVSVVGSLLIAF